MSLACRHLLYGMLDSNPAMRVSVEDALQHPWVTIDSPQGDSLRSTEVRCCSPPLRSALFPLPLPLLGDACAADGPYGFGWALRRDITAIALDASSKH